MATVAELQEELSALKAKMTSQEADTIQHREGSEPADLGSGLGETLAEHGLNADDISALWDQLLHELGEFPHRKPLITAGAAFALGFLAGRASKK